MTVGVFTDLKENNLIWVWNRAVTGLPRGSSDPQRFYTVLNNLLAWAAFVADIPLSF